MEQRDRPGGNLRQHRLRLSQAQPLHRRAPTIARYACNAGIEDLLLTCIGQALPAGFSLEGARSHDIATLQKAAAKRKETAKADRKRTEVFARLGF